MEKKSGKIVDGRMQLGIVIDWLDKNHSKLSIGEKSVYTTIAIGSLQRFHKKSPNIKMDMFNMDKKTLAKYRESLVTLGLIGYRRTRAYTAYWLLEPKEEIVRFYFKEDKKNDSAKASNQSSKSDIARKLF